MMYGSWDTDHMMYASWDIENNRQNFLSFWTVFCPFTLLSNHKIKILKKWKKHLKIWCIVPEMWSATDRYFVILNHFLPFHPLTTHRINIFKKWKKHCKISSFYMHASKIMIILLHCSWDKTHDKYNFYFLFWAIFYPFTPLQK